MADTNANQSLSSEPLSKPAGQYVYDEDVSILDEFPCLQNPTIRKGCLIAVGAVVVADLLTVAFHWGAICSGRLKTWLIGKYLVPLFSYTAALFYGPCLCGLAASYQSGMYNRVENWEDSENGLHGEFSSPASDAPEYSLQDVAFWRLAVQRPQETAQQVADDARLPFFVRVWLTVIANLFDTTVLEVIWLGYGAIALSRETWICSKQAPWLYHYTFAQVVIGCILILLIVVWMLASVWCPGQVESTAVAFQEKLGDFPLQMRSYGSRGFGNPLSGSSFQASESQPLVSGGATATTALKSNTTPPSSAPKQSPAAHRRSSTSGSIDITVANLDDEDNFHKNVPDDDVFAIGADDKDDDNEDPEREVCGMCQAILKPEDARSMNCEHKFHKACLQAWNLKKKCPTCKRSRRKKTAE